MAALTDTLTINQAASFRQSFTCSLADLGIADIEAWTASAPWSERSTFHLSFQDESHPRYELLSASYVFLDGNTVTLYITKEGSDRLRECTGRGYYTVKVTNGTDTHTIMSGLWNLKRASWYQTDLQTAWEDFDGIVLDCGAKYDATTSPEDKRMYVAHGRKVSAVRISDAKQMIEEDMYFSSVGTKLREIPRALHVDDVNDILYIITADGGLYSKDITVQSAPTDAYPFLDLSGYLTTGETMNDVCAWNVVGQEVVVVLTSKRLLTIKEDLGSLVVVGESEEISPSAPLTDNNPTSADSINDLLVTDFVRLTIGVTNTNMVVAYVVASARGYELTPATRPFSRILILCNLDLAGGYVAPYFTTPGSPYCVFYNPFPVAPSDWAAHVAAGGSAPDGSDAIKKTDYHVFDMDYFDDGVSQWLFVAHGRRNQVKKLDVTNTYTAGFVIDSTLVCHPDFGTDPLLAQDIMHVNVDPTDIDHLLIFEEDNEGPRVIDGNPPTSINLLANTTYGAGCPRNNSVIALSGKHFTVWTFDFQAVAFTFRVIDGSTNTPSAVFERWWYMNSDGMVAYPPNVIYQLSFGGVVPYRRDLENGGWSPDADGYQPSRDDDPDQPGFYINTNTETIDIGHNVSGSNDSRLFTCGAGMGFFEFKIDQDTLRPGAARLFKAPPEVTPLLPGWTVPTTLEAPGRYYSNDVVYTTVDGVPYVLIDVTNRPLSQWGLLAYRYDSVGDTWTLRHAIAIQSDYAAYEIPFTDSIVISRNTIHTFAIVQTGAGIFTVRIDELESAGTMSFCDLMYTRDFNGGVEPSAGTNALATSGRRIFINICPLNGNSQAAEMRVYEFDELNGMIDQGGPLQAISNSSVTLPSGHTWTSAFKLRAHFPNSRDSAALYLCGVGGTLIEFEYEAHLPSPLSFKSSWKSDYQNVIADAREYDFGDGPQVLVSKNVEGFAIVHPSAFKR